MTKTEKCVSLTAKIYEARAAMKIIATDQEYEYAVRDHQEAIRQVMHTHKVAEIEAAMFCIRALRDRPGDSVLAQTWVLVALAEMLEPS